jgi:N-acetylglucosamine malate deacetylase 1
MVNKTILVVVAHPDDEILGCGGTMARHADEGDEVHVIFMANGVSSRDIKNVVLDKINERKQAAIEACSIVGVKQLHFLDFNDNQMDTYSVLEIIQKLEKLINKIKPDVVYTHHSKDLNIDHQLTHRSVMTACRPQPESSVSEIYSFEVLSSTGWNSPYTGNEFIPNTFVDITKTRKKKLDALDFYNDELRDYPHARSYKSIESLMIFRGTNVGLCYAEAFQLERRIKVNNV